MKRAATFLLTVVLIMICSNITFAHTYDHDDDHLFLEVDYSLPYNNIYVEGSFSYGLGFRFWGIFYFSGIIADNSQFLTCGTGMKIPLGGFGMVLEWGKAYAVDGSGTIFDLCNSRKAGLEFELSDSIGLQVYKKYLEDFTPQSGMGGGIDLIGAGIVINF